MTEFLTKVEQASLADLVARATIVLSVAPRGPTVRLRAPSSVVGGERRLSAVGAALCACFRG